MSSRYRSRRLHAGAVLLASAVLAIAPGLVTSVAGGVPAPCVAEQQVTPRATGPRDALDRSRTYDAGAILAARPSADAPADDRRDHGSHPSPSPRSTRRTTRAIEPRPADASRARAVEHAALAFAADLRARCAGLVSVQHTAPPPPLG